MKSSNLFLNLLNCLKSKEGKIGIIGMGYVGLPLAIAYAEKGFKVLGIDIDKSKVEKINNSKSYINHIPSEKLKNLVNLKISLIANFTLLFQNSSELFSFKILTCKFPSPA